MSVGAVVPAYFHPRTAAQDWRLVEAVGGGWTCVVVNVADGPGDGRLVDVAYVEVIRRLHAADVTVAGYVDLAFGVRPMGEVLADVRAWRSTYGVSGVFLDRFPARFDAAVAETVRRIRGAGAPLVVVNPGVHPTPEALVGADVCVTFEGAWRDYRRLVPPGWAAQAPCLLAHLVHGVPPMAARRVRARAARFGAPCYATPESGTNPWRRLSRFVLPTRVGAR